MLLFNISQGSTAMRLGVKANLQLNVPVKQFKKIKIG